MTWHLSTGGLVTIGLLVLVVIAGVYDVFVVERGMGEQTISVAVLACARRHPVLPLLVGILLGHLFWSQDCGPRTEGSQQPGLGKVESTVVVLQHNNVSDIGLEANRPAL